MDIATRFYEKIPRMIDKGVGRNFSGGGFSSYFSVSMSGELNPDF